MATDTRDERASVLGYALPAVAVYPEPDNDVNVVDRQQVLWMYAGISAGAAVEAVVVPGGAALNKPVSLFPPELRPVTLADVDQIHKAVQVRVKQIRQEHQVQIEAVQQKIIDFHEGQLHEEVALDAEKRLYIEALEEELEQLFEDAAQISSLGSKHRLIKARMVQDNPIPPPQIRLSPHEQQKKIRAAQAGMKRSKKMRMRKARRKM